MSPRDHIHWTSYPALTAGVLVAAGVGVAAARPASFAVWAGLAGAAFLVYGTAVWRASGRLVSATALAQTLAVAGVLLAAGGARHALFQAKPPHHIHFIVSSGAWVVHTDEDVSVNGRIVGYVDRTDTRARFTLAADHVIVGVDTLRTTGQVRVTVNIRPFDRNGTDGLLPERAHLHAGAHVRLKGRLRPAPAPRNPADFDYGAYLQRQGIAATLYVPDPSGAEVLRVAPTGVTSVVSGVRTYVRAQIREHVRSAASASVMQALLLGDRHQIADSTRAAFTSTGLMHLLAVSGLHVLLVGMVFYQLLRPTLLRFGFEWRQVEWMRAAATASVLILYMLVTGGSASVVRAVVMAVLLMGSTLAQRSSQTLNTLGMAAVVLLMLRPTALFDVGFQLSFAAVGAIVTLNPVLQRLCPASWTARGARWAVVSNVTVSVAATLGTLPVLLAHFGYVSFAGLALNVVAIPCTTLAMSAGLMVIVTGSILPSIASGFGAAADLLVQMLLHTARSGADHLAWASFDGFITDMWVLVALMLGIGATAQWRRPRYRWRLIIGALTCVAVSVGAILFDDIPERRLEIVFFDVGHGDAALVRFPNGRHLLIDAGGRNPYVDYGERTVLPHLKRYGVRRLDVVVITHADADHLGGLPTLLRNVPVGRVLHNGWPSESKLYAEAQHLIDSLAVPSHGPVAGDTVALDPSVRVEVLGPPTADVVSANRFTENDASIILHIVHGQNRLLLMGDAEKHAERWLADRGGPELASTLVKVGHHGSATSSGSALVERVLPDPGNPVYAVVSVGRRNRYGLPDDEVLHRWTERGASVLQTAHEGAIWFRSDGATMRRIEWRR